MARLGSKLKSVARGAYYFARLTVGSKAEQAFYGAHFLNNLEGDTVKLAFERFAALETSAELLRTMPDPSAVLADRAALAERPPGALGRVFLDFVTTNGFDSEFMTGPAEMFSRMRGEDEQRAWFRLHISVIHDLRHVISGYDASPRGEFCNLCFTFGQSRHRGIGFICVLAAMLAMAKGDFGFLPAGLEAVRRGRESTLIDLLPWELCLGTSLAACRAALGVRPPKRSVGQVAPDAYVQEPAAGRVDPVHSFAGVLSPA